MLIAEDAKDVRDMLMLAFEDDGWEVFAAEDGREALLIYHQQLRDEKYFDLLLLDVRMPRLNGIAVGVNVRNMERFGAVRRAVHVYLTGKDDAADPEALKETAFADEYIRKPVDLDVLMNRCRELVGT